MRNQVIEGRATQSPSLLRTRSPHSEKNAPAPIGDTWIGRNEKKKRSSLKGAHSATPNPPLVSASSKG